jgi:ribonuclease P protein component
VYQAGLRRNSAHLTLRALPPSLAIPSLNESKQQTGAIAPQAQLSPVRVGISISQKVSKRATIRNRIKRQIRAIMQQFLPHIAEGWQLVIVVRPGATQCDYQQFLQELKQLLVNAEVINGY